MRPCKRRRVRGRPDTVYFKPAGIRKIDLEEVTIELDEYESIRLKDALGQSQEEASRKMGVSQPTFHRILASARKKLADGIVDGKAIRLRVSNTEDR